MARPSTTTSTFTTLFHPKDHNKLALLVLSMLAVAHWRRKDMRKRWLSAEQQAEAESSNNKQSLLRRFLDHPAGAYLIDNGCVMGMAYFILRFLPRPEYGKPLKSFFISVLTTVVLVEPHLLFEYFTVNWLYAHVPFFNAQPTSGGKVSHDWYVMLTDYLQCNLPAMTFGNVGVLVGNSLMLTAQDHDRLITRPEPIRLLPYLAKFLYTRLAVDVAFGVVHRAMHDIPWVYEVVHKRHHEHTVPQTPTNFHFRWIDLYLEAFFTLQLALLSMQTLGYPATYPEQVVLFLSMGYYESCSHAGKEIPTVSWFPLLSPLADFFTGCDQRLVEYHTRHHQLFRCNYSISPWPDKLMGTYRIDLPESYGGKKPAE